MKQLLIIALAFLPLGLIAQQQAPPQGINYQAVAIDNDGKEMVGVDLKGMPVREKEIRVRFSILKDSETGILNYREQHLVTTDAYGLFNVVIGQGIEDASPITFDQIDWGTGYHFLKVEIDIKGGTEYKDMGTQQLWSVPYALYSKYADAAGNGIESVNDNGDGTLTFTYLDGSTYTTPTLTGLTGPQGDTGPQGPQGDTGNGIVNTLDNGDGTFTFEYADGTTFTTSNLTGQQGIQGPVGPTGATGATGNGIASTTDNGDGTFTFTYDDGSTFTTSDLTGPQGIQGIQGVAGANGTNGLDGNGIASTTDNGDGTFTFAYDDGSTFTTSDLTGPQGAQGIQGVAGANGTNGLDGNGIASTVDNGDGTFTFTYDDGTTFTTSDLTGPQGPSGSSPTIHGYFSLSQGQDSIWIIPAGISLLEIDLRAGNGSSGQAIFSCAFRQGNRVNGCPGGLGASAKIFLTVSEGDEISLVSGVNGIQPNDVNCGNCCTNSDGVIGNAGSSSVVSYNALNIIEVTGGQGGAGYRCLCGSGWSLCSTPGSSGAVIGPSIGGGGLLINQGTLGGGQIIVRY